MMEKERSKKEVVGDQFGLRERSFKIVRTVLWQALLAACTASNRRMGYRLAFFLTTAITVCHCHIGHLMLQSLNMTPF